MCFYKYDMLCRSPKELTKAYEYLGINNKLGMTGRPGRPFGVLSTSKVIGCELFFHEIIRIHLLQWLGLEKKTHKIKRL